MDTQNSRFWFNYLSWDEINSETAADIMAAQACLGLTTAHNSLQRIGSELETIAGAAFTAKSRYDISLSYMAIVYCTSRQPIVTTAFHDTLPLILV